MLLFDLCFFPPNTERPSYAPPPAPAPTTVSISQHANHPLEYHAPFPPITPTLKDWDWDGDGHLQWGWRGNLSSIVISLEINPTPMLDKLQTEVSAAFFLPSHQICLSHPHSVCVALLRMDVVQLPVCAAIKDCCFVFLHVLSKSWTRTKKKSKQKSKIYSFFFFFWSLPPLFVVISHSCFVSFVSISKCPPPLGLWGTTHTAIWPTTTTGWEETPAETTG